MKILFLRVASYFNERNVHPENVMMPVDMAIMAAMAEQLGHDTRLLDTEAEPLGLDEAAERIRALRPELIVVKAKSPSTSHLFSLFEHPSLQGLGFKIIGYSHAFGEAPELFLQRGHLPFACVIFKEPERAFKEILLSWESGGWKQTRGIAYRGEAGIVRTPEMELVENLDELPSPKYDWFIGPRYFTFYPVPPFTRKKTAFMLASRGCPKQCIYCSPTLRQTYGSSARFHSIDRIVADMKELRGKGIRLIQFRDDIFTINHRFVESLCQRLIDERLGLKWIVQTHVNHVNEPLLRLMRKAGCVTIGFGIESGSKRVLDAIKKHNDLEHARIVFRVCRRIGIRTVGFFLVGNPGETLEEVESTRRLIRELSPDLIQVALFTPYRGSRAFHLLSKEVQERAEDFHHYNKVIHNFSRIDSETLAVLPKRLYLGYILTPKVLCRLVTDTLMNLVINPRVTLELVFSGLRYLLFRRAGP